MVKKNKIIIILSCSILILHSILILTLSSIPVYALSTGGLQTTIASIIMSLLLQTGTAPVNQSYIDMINTSYGVESSIGTIEDMISNGLLTETASGLVDTGLSTAIESQTAYTELGLADLFTTTADDVAGGVLAGSGGVNLANTAINCGTVGTIGAFAGAATVGVGLGVLINKAREYVGNFVKYGLPMSAQTRHEIAENFPEGYDHCSYVYYMYPNTGMRTGYYIFYQDGDVFTSYDDQAHNIWYQMYVYDADYKASSVNRKMYVNSTLDDNQTLTVNPDGWRSWAVNTQNVILEKNFNAFDTRQEALQYVEDFKEGLVEGDFYAPDIIGQFGNQKPGQIASMVPEGYDMTPVNMDDYQNYADLANDNTENNDVGEEQASDFGNLIDNLLVAPSLVPDQGVEIPTIPDRPVIPGQPITPDKDPITQEEQDLINSGLADTGLANVFPFCIPFDLFALVGNLKAGREAPVIVFDFPEQFGWGGIEIDLSAYDEVAQILRHMELLLFIIGLAVNTRSLIGAVG